MLKICNFSKNYGEKNAVSDLSLHISRGEIYGFIGHNGAGKTTTLKAIAGLIDFDNGDIMISDKSIRSQPLQCKQILSYIPDNPDMYDYLTGIKYLNFIADVYGMGNERDEKIRTLCSSFDLTEALGAPIGSYSHGMKQKLAIIAAFIHSPELIIMDEPFVGLDPKASHILKEMMREHCNAGGSIFFSTHVLDVAEKLCDKVAIIKEGRLVVSGSMDEVLGNESLESVFLELEDCAE